MTKPMLCFDVDGTLRDNVHHQVSSSTLKALNLLKEAGYRLVISSGRGVDSLSKTGLMELIEWDGFVCNNGQIVLDANKKQLFHASLEEEAILKTLEIAKELHYAVVLKSIPRMISKEPDEYVYESQRFFNSIIPPIGEYHGQEVDAMIVYGPKGYDYAPFLDIQGVNVLPGESTYADITIAGISKATGIHQLMDIYSIDHYIAFGDSLNDVEMFKAAYLSVAMGQGNPKLKEIATYVTDTIDEDGIYNACLHLELIKGEKKMTKEEAILKAHEMYAYETSEQADQENHDFDALWQSIYDVCQLATAQIIEDMEPEEIQEATNWLKETQLFTKDYQEKEINF